LITSQPLTPMDESADSAVCVRNSFDYQPLTPMVETRICEFG
jgi:hypothetical protein